jgi:hypothetical protein
MADRVAEVADLWSDMSTRTYSLQGPMQQLEQS